MMPLLHDGPVVTPIMIPNVRLYVSVYPADSQGGSSGRLYTRDAYWPFLPSAQQYTHHVNLIYSAEDDEWGASVQVKDAWWDAGGGLVTVQLQGLQLVPSKWGLERYDDRTGWDPKIDGDADAKLLASGWQLYGSRG